MKYNTSFLRGVHGLLSLAGLAVVAGAAEPYPKPPITPPAGHPRLFARPADVPGLKARMTNPFFAKSWRHILENSARAFDGTLATGPANYVPEIHEVAEACALRYLLEGDAAQGRKAIAVMRKVLPTVTYPKVQDITRAMGSTILSASLVYDWCYPLLSAEDRTLFITHMKRIARLTEIGYPPVRGSAVTGHSGEAQLMRDQLSGGVAMYDEDAEMYRLAAGRFFAEFVPARNFWYPGHWHHQGSSYGPYRFQWEMFAAWLFKRMSGQDVFSADQGQVPYSWVYAQRPDGVILPDGDCSAVLKRVTEPPFADFSTMLAANYYHDEVLNGVVTRANQARERLANSIWYFLLADPALKSKPLAALPLARYFPEPAGRLVARTGWEAGAAAPVAMAEMKISPWMFNNHQHLDAGHFQLWYKGALACSSGVYSYGSNHDVNYYKRTIAHNCVTVFDPHEAFVWTKPMTVLNDGGQRWPADAAEPPTLVALKERGHHVGRVLAEAIGPDALKPQFSHLAGDLTGAYSKKVESCLRSFVFLNLESRVHPAALLVYDRVRSAGPSFKKTWLLHCPEKPAVAEAGFTVRGAWGGRLDASVLWPARGDARLEAVGGAGREFLVNGAQQPGESKKQAGPQYENFGWRMELSPRGARQDDRFLVVMQVFDDGPSAAPLPVTALEGEAWTGAKLADWTIFFPKTGEELNRVSFRSEGSGRCLITGAAPGPWTIRGDNTTRTATVTEAGRSLEFTVLAGAIEAIRAAAP